MRLPIVHNILALLLLLPCLLFAQQQGANTQQQQRLPIIAGVTVEGNMFVDEATIISISGLRTGDELNPRSDAIPQAIKNLWQRKQFSDVRIVADKITSLGVFLKIVVKENPRFSSLEVIGNDKISYETIKKEAGKLRGDIISYGDVFDIVSQVRKLYEKEGLLFAKITADTIPTDTSGYIRVRLTVEEGEEYRVHSITVNGNKEVESSDLVGAFEDTKTKHWWEIWKSAKFDKGKFYKDDIPRLVRYYKGHGYLDADTVSVSYSLDKEKGGVDITINVTEGQKYYVRDVRFEGSTVYTDDILVKRLDIEKGKAVNEERIDKNLNGNEDQTDVRSLYLDNGYLQSSVVYDLKRVAKDSVDVNVQIFERDRFTIRRVDIAGNSKTQDRVVRRELYTRPGDFFNRAAIIRSIKGLGVLNYFNPEKLRPDVRPVSGSPNQVDLIYNVEERSTDVLNASLGYAGSFGLTFSAGFTFNNFDVSDPLRGGAGQIFNFQWDYGQGSRLQTFRFSLTEPWLWGKPTSVGFNIFDTRYFMGIDGRQTGASISLGRRFRFPDDYFRGDWSFSWQRVSETYGTGTPDRVFTDLSISQTFSRTSFDNLIFPSTGSRFRWNMTWGVGAVVKGTADYLKNEAQLEFVNPLLQVDGFNRLVMYLNSEFGYVTNLLSTASIIPQYQLYAMGGNGLGGLNVIPLRGYEDRSIGLSGNANRLIFRQTAELRFALSLNPMPIYLSAFAEAGNAWGSFREADMFSLNRSAGVGMRILLNPIGLIGFDYGYGFDTDSITKATSGWKFHFQFGR